MEGQAGEPIPQPGQVHRKESRQGGLSRMIDGSNQWRDRLESPTPSLQECQRWKIDKWMTKRVRVQGRSGSHDWGHP